MRFGVHLPQYGRASGPEEISRAARQAEDLGFADVWVYDHVAIPSDVPYPSSFAYDPLMALAWAAAATDRIRLGTSALVLPYRHPLVVAKMLGSLDRLSKGRLVLGVAVGWLEEEFDALGVPMAERGRRADETIDLLRTCWESEQPVSFEGPTVRFVDMKIRPTPERRVPIWVGGTSEAALRRALEKGDGWHGAFLSTDDACRTARRLRRERPDPERFTISMRLEWDGLAGDHEDFRRQLDAFAEAGFDHLMAAPAQRTIDDWTHSVEALRTLFEPHRSP